MIELLNVSKSFGSKKLFKGLNLKIEPSKITAIVGGSGSGKTTLLNLIGLLDTDYSGTITINDVVLSKLNARSRLKFIREHINYLFQDFALVESETVAYNLLLSLEYTPLSKKEKQALIQTALTKVGLANFESNYIYTLSGGEQQRIALARTMIKPGDFILTDEPTGNLDEANANAVLTLLEELKNENKTVVIVTHNLEIAKRCDCIIDIHKLK